MATLTKEKVQKAYDSLKSERGYTNKFQAPRLVKIVVSSGTGKAKDKNRNKLVEEKLTTITGQKPAARAAKASIAQFKLREGEVIGYQVTLRGARMYEFLDKLIHIALPRTRDFRGLNDSAVDDMGNLTIGIKENTIFPETSDEDLKDVFGLAVTVVTTATSREDALPFFHYLGIPFKK